MVWITKWDHSEGAPMPDPTTEELVAPYAVPALLPYSPRTHRPYSATAVYRWIENGKMPSVRRGKRVYVRISDVMNFGHALSAWSL